MTSTFLVDSGKVARLHDEDVIGTHDNGDLCRHLSMPTNNCAPVCPHDESWFRSPAPLCIGGGRAVLEMGQLKPRSRLVHLVSGAKRNDHGGR